MEDSVAKRLRGLRKSHNMTQTQLAEVLGVTRTTVSNWEKGVREADVSVWCRYSVYFGVSTDYISGRTDKLDTYVFPPDCSLDVTKLSSENKKRLREYYNYLLTLEN